MTRRTRSYKDRSITEFNEYSDKSIRHFIQVMKQWRDFKKMTLEKCEQSLFDELLSTTLYLNCNGIPIDK